MIHRTFRKHLFWCLMATLFVSQSLLAQQLTQKIPFDSKVRTGTLKNGLKYYIRKNAKPENRVELRLAVNAGSLQENDNQQGLAHFVEHMAFNGTKNFKKNELVSYLQSAGVKFGAHLNAYTSFDETVYMLLLPTDKKDIFNKGFQILEDWAHGITFENEEIDKERGVILEEERARNSAGLRMVMKHYPVMFNGARYGKRMPIGKKEILKNFKYKTIKQFYKDWYRPDLMAVIAVGDIDLDATEKKIKEHFSRIKPVKNPRKKLSAAVPPHNDTKVSIQSDKETMFSQVRILYKKPVEKFATLADYRRQLMYSLHSGMMSQRLSELTEKANPPFVNAYFGYGNEVRTIDAYSGSVLVKDGDFLGGLKALLTESKRVRKHGFTQGELDRYKKVMLNRYKRAYNERNKTNSRNYAREYVAHSLTQDPSPGIEFEYEFVKKQLPGITLNEINQLSKKWVTKDNRVVTVSAPKKEGVKIPTEAEIRKVLKEVAFNPVKPYQDKAISANLMDKMPTPGKVVKTKTYAKSGVTELTLSNGVQVRLKPSKFKDDQILFDGFSMGGTSLVNDNDFWSARNAPSIVVSSGVGKFKAVDIRKMMAGKTVRVTPYIRQLSEGVSGSTTPADLETALQMTYMLFTNTRRDETAFKAMIAKDKSFLKNIKANPNFYFQEQVAKILTKNHPRTKFFPEDEDYAKMNLDKALKIYKERFADASDFKFTFVGNFEVDKIKPLLEKYLGSLPATNRKETYRDLGVRPPKGMINKKFYKGKAPRSQVNIIFTGEAKHSDKDEKLLKSLAEALSIKLIEKLREEKGGVYGAGAFASMSEIPAGSYRMQVSFPCAPENVNDLITATLGEIEKIQKNGVTNKDLKKVQAQQKRTMETSMENNRYWLNSLRSSQMYNKDPEKIVDYQKGIDALTSKDIQKVAKKYLDTKNYIRVVLYPESMKK